VEASRQATGETRLGVADAGRGSSQVLCASRAATWVETPLPASALYPSATRPCSPLQGLHTSPHPVGRVRQQLAALMLWWGSRQRGANVPWKVDAGQAPQLPEHLPASPPGTIHPARTHCRWERRRAWKPNKARRSTMDWRVCRRQPCGTRSSMRNGRAAAELARRHVTKANLALHRPA